MTDTTTDASRNRILLTSLGIMLIFILTLLVLLAAYPVVLAPPPTLTPTITLTRTITLTPSLTPTITLTPRPTRTRRPSFSPTASLTPSLTPRPSQTPTPPGPPTLTPARPLVGQNIYSLHPWSPEKVDQVVMLVNDYPNTLPRQARGENNENYHAAFLYAVDAHKEALLRFPEAPQAKAWRWNLAYNLAQVGDPRAGEAYASLIADALNQGETDPVSLSDWFQSNEPLLELTVSEMKPLPGYLSSHVVNIGGNGGAALLLLETPTAYQTQVLVSAFDFVKPAPLEAFARDLTGDGVEEVIVYNPTAPDDRVLVPPLVFDLSQTSAQELPFDPSLANFPIGTDFSAQWSAVPDGPNGTGLQVKAELFPFCPVIFTRSYLWTGEWFEGQPPQFEITPDPSTLAYCDLVLEHAYHTWGAGTALQLAEALLPIWPPETDVDSEPYPPDTLDELRFRTGIYLALTGEFDRAVTAMNEVITEPTIAESHWVIAAKDFLEIYRTPQDLYRACSNEPSCDASQALKLLVENQPASSYPTIQTYLWESGAALRASGYYDFDSDATNEIWFTVQHRPGESLELWVLAPYLQGIKALHVDTIESNRPDLVIYKEGEVPPVIILDGNTAFQMGRLPGTLLPYLTYPQLPQFFPNRFDDKLDAIIDDFFNGADPREIKLRLLLLQESPGLLCEVTWSCDRYYYFLALASELAGDHVMAIETNLKLWWDYSKSPFTTMVRLRLRGPAVTPTLSPTITRTVLITLTPTVTGTLPTATPTPDPNATATPTVTVTIPATPYPYPAP